MFSFNSSSERRTRLQSIRIIIWRIMIFARQQSAMQCKRTGVVDWDEETETTATERVLQAKCVLRAAGRGCGRTGSTGRHTRPGFSARGAVATFPLLLASRLAEVADRLQECRVCGTCFWLGGLGWASQLLLRTVQRRTEGGGGGLG